MADPESRHVHKTRSVYRDGCKAHIAAEPDTGLITAVDGGYSVDDFDPEISI